MNPRVPALAPWLLAGLLALSGVAANAQAPRSVPVDVINLPAVQSVEDVNEPAFQPVQMNESNSTTVTGPTLLVTGAFTDPVPAGKQLVVQHASVDVSSEDIQNDPVCRFVVRVLSPFQEIVAHRVPTEREFDGARERAVISLPITLYAQPGEEVGASCTVRVAGNTTLSVAVTGYYVDIVP